MCLTLKDDYKMLVSDFALYIWGLSEKIILISILILLNDLFFLYYDLNANNKMLLQGFRLVGESE